MQRVVQTTHYFYQYNANIDKLIHYKFYLIMTVEKRIEEIIEAIQIGQSLDVKKLRQFLLNGANVPLYCVGSGGFSLPMRYCALMYAGNKGMSQACTPMIMNHVSDETLKHSKVLLYSNGGSQVDTGFLFDRMAKCNPNGLAGIGAYNQNSKYPNTMIKEMRKVSGNWCLYNIKANPSFVSLSSPLTMCTAIYRAFTNDQEPLSRLTCNTSSDVNYTFQYKGGKIMSLPSLKDIKTFICLYGGWGEPVAYTFENVMTEAGLTNVQLCDVRNWCHGRFIFLSNHIEESALVMFISPREKQYVERLLDARDYRDKDKKVFPDNIMTIVIETEYDEPIATLDLAVKSTILINDIANSFGVDIANPKNKASIDKRVPRPLKMTEQEEFGAVNLSLGKTGSLKGVSRKQVIQYNPRLTIKQIAEKNGVSEATIRMYIKENHIDRERDCQLLIYLKVRKVINEQPDISIIQMSKKVKCATATAKKYMQMTSFDIPVKKGHISLVHDDTL